MLKRYNFKGIGNAPKLLNNFSLFKGQILDVPGCRKGLSKITLLNDHYCIDCKLKVCNRIKANKSLFNNLLDYIKSFFLNKVNTILIKQILVTKRCFNF